MPVVTRKSSRNGAETQTVKSESQDNFQQFIEDFKIQAANRSRKRKATLDAAIKAITDGTNILISKLPKEDRDMKFVDYIEKVNAKNDDVTTAHKENTTPMSNDKKKKEFDAPAKPPRTKVGSDPKVNAKPTTRNLRSRNIQSNPPGKRNEARTFQPAKKNKEKRAFSAISAATGKGPTKLDSRVKPINATHFTINLVDENSKLAITKSSGETLFIDERSCDQLDDVSLQSLRNITKTLNNFLTK